MAPFHHRSWQPFKRMELKAGRLQARWPCTGEVVFSLGMGRPRRHLAVPRLWAGQHGAGCGRAPLPASRFSSPSPNSSFSLKAQLLMEEVVPKWPLRNCTDRFSLNSLPNEPTESCASWNTWSMKTWVGSLADIPPMGTVYAHLKQRKYVDLDKADEWHSEVFLPVFCLSVLYLQTSVWTSWNIA